MKTTHVKTFVKHPTECSIGGFHVTTLVKVYYFKESKILIFHFYIVSKDVPILSTAFRALPLRPKPSRCPSCKHP